jgi:hypothetical protein
MLEYQKLKEYSKFYPIPCDYTRVSELTKNYENQTYVIVTVSYGHETIPMMQIALGTCVKDLHRFCCKKFCKSIVTHGLFLGDLKLTNNMVLSFGVEGKEFQLKRLKTTKIGSDIFWTKAI